MDPVFVHTDTRNGNIITALVDWYKSQTEQFGVDFVTWPKQHNTGVGLSINLLFRF
jgi:hypothetical protein